jgi:sarcosine oxidase delta subunit
MNIQNYGFLRKDFVALMLAITLSACNRTRPEGPVAAPIETNTSDGKRLEEAAWLLGEWRNNTPRGVLYEAWRVKDDSTYTGRSCFVVGKDTVSAEVVNLEMRGGKLLYIPTVRDQNSGQPITFTETTVTEKEMIFENPAHDFPQRITYTQITQDSMVAVISGMQGKKSVQFPMRRIK